jgi:phospholipase/carboxylesterase
MALSTYLPLADSLALEAAAANRATPMFMAHGTFDPVVPLVMGAGSMTFLAGLGYKVEWKQYPMQHSVCAEEIEDVGEWLRRVLRQQEAVRG